MTRSPFILGALLFCALWQSESMADEFVIRPIGKVVQSGNKTFLEVFPPYLDALLGITDFSHVLVFYWFDRNDTPEKRSTLQVHPRRDKTNPLRGVFATRSPARPNLIGLSICKIKSVDNGRILVDAIDAFDQTPIIDLKPYIPGNDCVDSAHVPAWVKRNRGAAD